MSLRTFRIRDILTSIQFLSVLYFKGVVYPIRSRTRRRNIWYYLLPVLLLAIGFNIPKALEIRVNVVEVRTEIALGFEKFQLGLLFFQLKNETSWQAGESDLARNVAYAHYYKVWSNLIITAIVPIAILIFCNLSIFLQMRKSRKEMQNSRHQRSSNQQNPEDNHSTNGSCQSADYNLAMILAGIVIVFCVCHSLRVFLAFYYVSVMERTNECIVKGKEAAHPSWLYVISALNHLMLMVNSSINFIIYCAVGSKFRKVLKDKFFPSRSSGSARTNQIEIQQFNGHLSSRIISRQASPKIEIEVVSKPENGEIQRICAYNQTKTCSTKITDL